MSVLKQCKANIILVSCYAILGCLVYTFIADYFYSLAGMNIGLRIALDFVVAIIILAIGAFCGFKYVKSQYKPEIIEEPKEEAKQEEEAKTE